METHSNGNGRVDALQELYHSLDKKMERVLTLLEGRKERDEAVEDRLKTVEVQVSENTQALRVIRWVGGVAFTAATVIAGYLIKIGLDTVAKLIELARK